MCAEIEASIDSRLRRLSAAQLAVLSPVTNVDDKHTTSNNNNNSNNNRSSSSDSPSPSSSSSSSSSSRSSSSKHLAPLEFNDADSHDELSDEGLDISHQQQQQQRQSITDRLLAVHTDQQQQQQQQATSSSLATNAYDEETQLVAEANTKLTAGVSKLLAMLDATSEQLSQANSVHDGLVDKLDACEQQLAAAEARHRTRELEWSEQLEEAHERAASGEGLANAYEMDVADKRQQIERLEAQLANANGHLDELSAQLEASKSELASLATVRRELEAQRHLFTKELDSDGHANSQLKGMCIVCQLLTIVTHNCTRFRFSIISPVARQLTLVHILFVVVVVVIVVHVFVVFVLMSRYRPLVESITQKATGNNLNHFIYVCVCVVLVVLLVSVDSSIYIYS